MTLGPCQGRVGVVRSLPGEACLFPWPKTPLALENWCQGSGQHRGAGETGRREGTETPSFSPKMRYLEADSILGRGAHCPKGLLWHLKIWTSFLLGSGVEKEAAHPLLTNKLTVQLKC